MRAAALRSTVKQVAGQAGRIEARMIRERYRRDGLNSGDVSPRRSGNYLNDGAVGRYGDPPNQNRSSEASVSSGTKAKHSAPSLSARTVRPSH
jgi:hypothetical protein